MLTCWLMEICVSSPGFSAWVNSRPLAVWAGSRPLNTNSQSSKKVEKSEWAEYCDERRRRRRRGQVLKWVRVCWWGKKITPESAHSPAQTHRHTHTPTFFRVWFAVLVWCWGRFLHEPPLSPPPLTHTYTTNTPLLLTPWSSRPPLTAQSASAWRRQSMRRAPLSVSAQGRAKGPSAGDCGKSDLWCPRCCWPLTFALSLFIFPFVSPSLPHTHSLLPVLLLYENESNYQRSVWNHREGPDQTEECFIVGKRDRNLGKRGWPEIEQGVGKEDGVR